MDNDILRKKGQINLGFIIAVVMLVVVIISATMFLLDMVPSYRYRSEQDILNARVNSLAVVMLDSPGDPPDWNDPTVNRIGLAYWNPSTGETELGNIDMEKVAALESMDYGTVKSKLGLAGVDFSLYIAELGTPVLDFNTGAISETGTVVTLGKSSVLVSSYTYYRTRDDLPDEIRFSPIPDPELEMLGLIGWVTVPEYKPVEVTFTLW